MSTSRKEKVEAVEKIMEALEPWLLQLMRFSLNDTAVAEERRRSAKMLVDVVDFLEKLDVSS